MAVGTVAMLYRQAGYCTVIPPTPSPVDENKPTKEELEAIKKHQEKEQETQALLQLAIGPPSELAHMYGAQNAAEMWKQLSNVKEPKGIHRVVNA